MADCSAAVPAPPTTTSPARLAKVFDLAIAQLRSQLQTALEDEVLSPLAALQNENAQLREQLYAAAALPSGDAATLSTSAIKPALSPEGAFVSGDEMRPADVDPDESAPRNSTSGTTPILAQTSTPEQSNRKKDRKTVKRRKGKPPSNLLPPGTAQPRTILSRSVSIAGETPIEAEDNSLEAQHASSNAQEEDRPVRELSRGSLMGRVRSSGGSADSFNQMSHTRSSQCSGFMMHVMSLQKPHSKGGNLAKHKKKSILKPAKSNIFFPNANSSHHTSRGSTLDLRKSQAAAHRQFGSISPECIVEPTKLGRPDAEDSEASDDSEEPGLMIKTLSKKPLRTRQSMIGALTTDQLAKARLGPELTSIEMDKSNDSNGLEFDALFVLHKTWQRAWTDSKPKFQRAGKGIQESLTAKSMSLQKSRPPIESDNDSDTPSELVIAKKAESSSFFRLQQRFMVQPSSLRRLSWDFFGLFLICWDIVWLPFLLFEPDDSLGTEIAGWITRIFWTLDIPASFLTGTITVEGDAVMCPRRVSQDYVKKRLAFDCLIVIPDWIEVIASTTASFVSAARVVRVLRTFRILRMMRLARMLKLPGLLNKIAARVFSERIVLLMDIAKSTVFIIIIAHVFACFWYKLATMQDHNWLVEHSLTDEALQVKYAVSLHWSIARFIGEPPVNGVTFDEHIFEILSLILSFVMSAAFVSTITTSMTRLQIIGVEDENNFTMLRRYLRTQAVSTKLAMRITKNARFAVQQQKAQLVEDDVILFQLLSEPLMIELHYEVYGRVLQNHPAFELYCFCIPEAMRKICHSGVSVHHCTHGDVLFKKGELPEHGHMFMLIHGKLKYERESSDKHYVEQGQWVSEMVLWANWVHCGNLRVETDCSLLALSADKVQKIGDSDLDIEADIRPAAYAKWFVSKMNELQVHEITDLDPGFGLPPAMSIAAQDDAGISHDHSNWGNVQETIANLTATTRRSMKYPTWKSNFAETFSLLSANTGAQATRNYSVSK